MLGIVGAAMFFGDSLITPAISVLSAVEGLKLVTPALEHYVLPITVVILIGLFAVQRAAPAGRGPLRAGDGGLVRRHRGRWALLHISDDPGVFAAINPVLCRQRSC